jgi:hypothetical protein
LPTTAAAATWLLGLLGLLGGMALVGRSWGRVRAVAR